MRNPLFVNIVSLLAVRADEFAQESLFIFGTLIVKNLIKTDLTVCV